MKAQCLLALLLCGCLTSNAWSVGASGFSNQMVGAKAQGQGNAFVAEADDPSAVYYNPAGMTQVPGTQLSLGTAILAAHTDRTGAGVPDDAMKRQLSPAPNFCLTSSRQLRDRPVAFGI